MKKWCVLLMAVLFFGGMSNGHADSKAAQTFLKEAKAAKTPKQLNALFKKALLTRKVDVFRIAAQGLLHFHKKGAKTVTEGTTPILLKRLNGKHRSIQIWAAMILGRLKEKKALMPLCHLSNEVLEKFMTLKNKDLAKARKVLEEGKELLRAFASIRGRKLTLAITSCKALEKAKAKKKAVAKKATSKTQGKK